MLISRSKRSRALLAFTAAPLAVMFAHGTARAWSTNFNAALEQCSAVTIPAALTTCPTAPNTNDPLTQGKVQITADGDVDVSVNGAGPSQTYAVVFRSIDGSTSTPIGSLTTDKNGNGKFQAEDFFLGNGGAIGATGGGNIVLTRGGFDQYVSGIAVAAQHGPAGQDYQPELVRCSQVTIPAALSNCGSDPLNKASVDIESDDGDLSIQLHGAAPNATYNAFLRPPAGADLALGSFGTDKNGNGNLSSSDLFAKGSFSYGTIVLEDGSSKQVQFLSGFQVTQHSGPQTVTKSSLVPCGEVTKPVLSGCGADPLSKGSAEADSQGNIKVSLQGATPNVSYEVFFRPVDNSGDLDTLLAVSTDSNGNGANKPFFYFQSKPPTTAAGNFLLKRAGSIQFLTGFTFDND